MSRMKNNLREIRESKKPSLSQEALGALCNPPISGPNISRYESTIHYMDPPVLEKVAKALGVSPYAIYQYDDEISAPTAELDENLLKQCAHKTTAAAKLMGLQLDSPLITEAIMEYYKMSLKARLQGESLEPSITIAALILERKTA